MPQTKETGGVAEHYPHYMLNLSGCYIYNQDILPCSALRVNIFTILSYTTTALIHDDLKQQKGCWLSQDKILKCDKNEDGYVSAYHFSPENTLAYTAYSKYHTVGLNRQ